MSLKMHKLFQHQKLSQSENNRLIEGTGGKKRENTSLNFSNNKNNKGIIDKNDRTEILSHQYLISSVLRVFLSKIDKQLDVANRIKLALEKQAMMCLLYLEERKRAKEKQSEIIRGLVPSLEEAIENQERSIKESHKACLG